MESLTFFLGVLGNIFAFLVFLSPVKTFMRVVKNKSTEEFDSLPYICTLLNSSLWTYYGIIRPGSFLVSTVNGIGVIIETVYVALFLTYAPPKVKKRVWVLAGIMDVGVFVAAIVVAQFVLTGDARIDVIGFMCSGLNIIMFASPLAVMKTVVRTQSVEYMPFLLSFFLCLSGGVWSFYALLMHDWYVLVPNGLGFPLGIAQLVLYAMYRERKPKPIDIEEASHRERLLPTSFA